MYSYLNMVHITPHNLKGGCFSIDYNVHLVKRFLIAGVSYLAQNSKTMEEKFVPFHALK